MLQKQRNGINNSNVSQQQTNKFWFWFVESDMRHHACVGTKRYLLCSSLNATVLAGDVFTVPVFSCPTGEAQVRVTLSYSQVTRTLLGVTLGLTAATWKPILTCTDRENLLENSCFQTILLKLYILNKWKHFLWIHNTFTVARKLNLNLATFMAIIQTQELCGETYPKRPADLKYGSKCFQLAVMSTE